ncbi:MAG: hypothetical protein JXD23_08050 [Spirochaetales bacterium]|nr:hypothetical protein [Spirochaetales bacterium]
MYSQIEIKNPLFKADSVVRPLAVNPHEGFIFSLVASKSGRKYHLCEKHLEHHGEGITLTYIADAAPEDIVVNREWPSNFIKKLRWFSCLSGRELRQQDKINDFPYVDAEFDAVREWFTSDPSERGEFPAFYETREKRQAEAAKARAAEAKKKRGHCLPLGKRIASLLRRQRAFESVVDAEEKRLEKSEARGV